MVNRRGRHKSTIYSACSRYLPGNSKKKTVFRGFRFVNATYKLQLPQTPKTLELVIFVATVKMGCFKKGAPQSQNSFSDLFNSCDCGAPWGAMEYCIFNSVDLVIHFLLSNIKSTPITYHGSLINPEVQNMKKYDCL